MPQLRVFALLLCHVGLAGVVSAQDSSQPFVHPLFSDHMVLQRGKEVPVWGWAKPGASVKVSFAGESASATANESGKWMARLGPFEASGQGRALTISGPEDVALRDVLVGDVWICSGQSNMEWPVAASQNPEQEIAAANHPGIRLFTVPKRISTTPQEIVDGMWSTCSKDTVPGFSAVGYFFGRELHKSVGVPIGLIHTSWGGTVAEAWTSGAALKSSMPDFADALANFERTVEEIAAGKFDFATRVEDWWTKNDAGSDEGNAWSRSDHGHADWNTMSLPNNWETADVGMDDFDGIVWFRKEFDLPVDWSGRDVVLSLGPIDDADTTWVNGHKVGGEQLWTTPRNYKVSARLLKPGRNVIAVRVFDNAGGGGIYDKSHQIGVVRADDKTKRLGLNGNWHFKASAPKNKLMAFPQQFGNNPNTVSVLYNGMLAPLTPFGITGAIWYQGESNAAPVERAMQYRRLLPTMIGDWRKRFGQGDFPFLIVQLANFMQRQEQPAQSGWAELREAQLLTAQRDDHVGLAVTTDIGEAFDIHPKNKQDVGKRLAMQALHIAYDHQLVHSGPTLQDMSIVGDTLHLAFDNVGAGLVVHGDRLNGFAIAEAEGEFVWADAQVEGNTVIVAHEDLAEPIRVRYNWANNPIGNLFNREGLPAGPFRTDVPRTPAPRAQPVSGELPTAEPEAVGMSAAKLAKVKPILQRFVDEGKVPGAIVCVAKNGKVVLFESVGYRDIAAQKPMTKDSILRFYSMTKAITSVSVMMLVEEGKLALDDPVEKYIPEFRDLQVASISTGGDAQLVEQTRRMTIRDLLRHTSGLTYGFFGNTAVDTKYRQAGVLAATDTLQDMVDKLGQLPLLYQPGTRFNYSVSTDVLGHVIERVSGTELDEFFQQRVFGPLDMRDTGFQVDREAVGRFANNYAQNGSGLVVSDDAATSRYLVSPKLLSGGGGLVSTARDYIRFCQMLLNEGELNGNRLLGVDTVRAMTRNQLSRAAYPINLNGSRDGVGFGLGFSVVMQQTSYTKSSRLGEFGWGGAASTHFWISPSDALAVVVLTQHQPFSFQLEDAVKPLVYEAIID